MNPVILPKKKKMHSRNLIMRKQQKKSKLGDIHQQGAGNCLTTTSPKGDNQKMLCVAFPHIRTS